MSDVTLPERRTFEFPEDFRWGVAIAAYQSEGGWDADGKGESNWDRYTHDDPSRVEDRSNGDIACDCYHKYKEDVQLIKDIAVKSYRFSIAWSRIFPDGKTDNVNQKGVDYYNNLIDECLANGIEPMITLSHFDLPQTLEDKGGWLSESLIELFADYARFCYQTFGDRVKLWLTFNEINMLPLYGYGTGVLAPGIKDPGVSDYIVGHNCIRAHARAWHIYDEEFRAQQNGKVGVSYDIIWFEPATSSEADKAATQRAMELVNNWLIHPIFSEEGDYPPAMRELIDSNSAKEGKEKSRLPSLSEKWKKELKGASDYIAIQQYTTFLVSDGAPENLTNSSEKEGKFTMSQSKYWYKPSKSPFFAMVPQGMRRSLAWVKEVANDPEIMVTECGAPDDDGSELDLGRIRWLKLYIAEAWKAKELDGANLTGWYVWSIFDNFEWSCGYKIKFGLYQVRFYDPYRKRSPKNSATFYRELIKSSKVTLDKLDVADLERVYKTLS